MPQSFTFHNVGQGLFYTGKIDDFNFVYDCGSLSKYKKYLFDSVNNYVGNVKKLNLLIISHLHIDHISGLDTLLNRVKVDKVILPYFLPLERLIISLRNLKYPRWVFNFLSDPMSYSI